MAGGKPGKGEAGRYVAGLNQSGGRVYLHRVVAERMGIIPSVVAGTGGKWSESIDHANGEKLDNRRSNLRLRTRSQQETNPNDELRRNNTSGIRGVSLIKRTGKWMAHATESKRSISLGHYATKDEAVAARLAWDTAKE